MPPNATTLLNRFIVRAKFRHMQVLVRLAELGSMRRAAKAVHMTQPAISGMVAELENLMETELFFRHARGVEPTAATKVLLPIAQQILGALEDGAENVANCLQEQGGVVRVSASPAAIGGLIRGRLDGFATRYPDIQVHITYEPRNASLGGIVDETADIVCTREPPVIPEGWVFQRCLDDCLIAVCGQGHPFAAKAEREIAPDNLGQAKWLLNRVGSVARDRFEEVAARFDWPASCRCQMIMHIPSLTREMLLTGRYLAILPRSVAAPWLAAGEVVQLRTAIDTPLAPLGFLWRGEKSGSATAVFAAHLSEPGLA